jgi:hypothetical protein
MTDARWEAMTAEEQQAYLEQHDFNVCEACHEPHNNVVAGMVSEMCKACEKKF